MEGVGRSLATGRRAVADSIAPALLSDYYLLRVTAGHLPKGPVWCCCSLL